jgi:hypothetical protein
MRSKVANGIRRAVYGDRKSRKAKRAERTYMRLKNGSIMENSTRGIYQKTKNQIKALGSKNLAEKAFRLFGFANLTESTKRD